MTRWVVIFQDLPEMLEIRGNKSLRDAHVAFARERDELIIGGGLKPDPESEFCGALWVVEANSRQEVEDLVFADPFYDRRYRDFEIFTWGKILEDETVTL